MLRKAFVSLALACLSATPALAQFSDNKIVMGVMGQRRRG
jgi:hypothetical protein